MAKDKNKRVYPIVCTSSFCGEHTCEGCPHEADLLAFKAWVAKKNATPADPIWSPLVFVARKRKR